MQLSFGEAARADVLVRADCGLLSAYEAALLLGVSERQVYRLLKRYRLEGLSGLASRRRGRPSNNRLPKKLREQAVELCRTTLAGYGPTQASEVLRDEYGLLINRETLRGILLAEGLFSSGGRRSSRKRVRQKRLRAQQRGEIIQVDATRYTWVEGEEPCELLVFIDDATGCVGHLSFAPAESTLAYLHAFKTYVLENGLPVAVYADGHPALFKQDGSDQRGNPILRSPVARALRKLNVLCIPSKSAEGRGRVERGHSTHKDRLPKFLKRRGARTIEEASLFLEEYRQLHNRNFEVPPALPENQHRQVPADWDLELIFAERHLRRLSPKLSISWKAETIFLQDCRASRTCIGREIEVFENLDGARFFAGKTEVAKLVDFRTTSVLMPMAYATTCDARNQDVHESFRRV